MIRPVAGVTGVATFSLKF